MGKCILEEKNFFQKIICFSWALLYNPPRFTHDIIYLWTSPSSLLYRQAHHKKLTILAIKLVWKSRFTRLSKKVTKNVHRFSVDSSSLCEERLSSTTSSLSVLISTVSVSKRSSPSTLHISQRSSSFDSSRFAAKISDISVSSLEKQQDSRKSSNLNSQKNPCSSGIFSRKKYLYRENTFWSFLKKYPHILFIFYSCFFCEVHVKRVTIFPVYIACSIFLSNVFFLLTSERKRIKRHPRIPRKNIIKELLHRQSSFHFFCSSHVTGFFIFSSYWGYHSAFSFCAQARFPHVF